MVVRYRLAFTIVFANHASTPTCVPKYSQHSALGTMDYLRAPRKQEFPA